MDDDDDDECLPPLIHRAGCATIYVADYANEITLSGKGGPIHGGTVWAVHLQPQDKYVRGEDGQKTKVNRVACTAYRVASITEDEGDHGEIELIVVIEDQVDKELQMVVIGTKRPDHCQGMWALVVKDDQGQALDCQEVVEACGNWMRHGYWIEYGKGE